MFFCFIFAQLLFKLFNLIFQLICKILYTWFNKNFIGEIIMEKNTIFVGSKPVMNYVLAVVTQFNEGSDSVLLRARGKAISRAVDAAEIVRNRFVPDSDVTDIQISTEEIENYNNEKTNVSIIEILIEKEK